MAGKGPSALVSEKSIELQGKEQKHKLQKPRGVSNLPPTTWSWTRAGAVTWHSGSDTTIQSLGSVQRRGHRKGMDRLKGEDCTAGLLGPWEPSTHSNRLRSLVERKVVGGQENSHRTPSGGRPEWSPAGGDLALHLELKSLGERQCEPTSESLQCKKACVEETGR